MTSGSVQKCLAAAWAVLPMAGALAAGPYALESPSPGQTVSGIDLVSGWACNVRSIEAVIDDGPPWLVAYGTTRPDTAQVCGGNPASGYGLLLNWNNWSPGRHTVVMRADGVEFARREFTVVSLGGARIEGTSPAPVVVPNFPHLGRSLVLRWNEAAQRFVVAEFRDQAPSLNGRWNGADLERRSGCTAPQNDGNHGTYAQYSIDIFNGHFSMAQTGVTGLNCTYSASWSDTEPQIAGGEYSCTDGKRGTFTSTGVLVTDREMSLQLAIKLTGSETCTIDATVGGSRY